MNDTQHDLKQLRIAGLATAFAVLVLDQLSKWWMLTDILSPPTLLKITPFFNLVLTWNRGISFGFFKADSPWGTWLLAAVAGVIVIFLLRWMFKGESRLSVVALGLIVGGAIGNVIDRVRFGAVVDFLDFHLAGTHFPAFNVADSAITVGAAALVLEALFAGPEQPKNNTHE